MSVQMSAQPEVFYRTAPEVDVVLAQRILDHFKERIAATQAAHEPFDHMFVENIFPDDVYADMLRLKIGSDQLEALNAKRWSRADGTSTRDRMLMTTENFALLDDERRRFWSTIAHVLKSDVYRRAVFAKMKGDIALRLGVSEDEVLDTPGYIHASIVRDVQGYRIKPHPDGWPSVVTAMFYLPQDESQLDLGTSLYAERGFPFSLIGKKYKEVYRFPFKPNGMSAFAVNDLPNKRSMHGRELVESDGERNSIILTFANESRVLKNSDHAIEPAHHELS